MTATLLTHFKQRIQSLSLEPSSGGCFELAVDGKPIHSKLATGAFPDEEAMVRALAKLDPANK